MSTTVIVGILALIVLSVVGSIIFHKKEQAATERRQKVAGYRFKADEAQDLYDGLINAGLEKKAYKFLLERIVLNLKAAHQVDPNAPGIGPRLKDAEQALNNADTASYYVKMPSGIQEMQALVNRLNKFVKYLVILMQKRAIPENQYSDVMPALQTTLLRFDAEGHIKMGNQAANDGQLGTAKQCYTYAKEQLMNFDAEDSYAQAQIAKVDELMQYLEEQDKSINKEALKQQQVSSEPEEEKSEAALAQEQINKQNQQDGDFTPKKKW